MKRTRALLAIFLLPALLPPLPALNAQAPKTDQLHTMTTEQIGMVKVLVAQERAWNAGDIDGYLSGYKHSPETLFLGANSVTQGYDSIAQHYRESYSSKEKMGTLSFENLVPHVIDATHGYLTGSFHLERSRKNGGNADGVFSLILEKGDTGWKIILDHTT